MNVTLHGAGAEGDIDVLATKHDSPDGITGGGGLLAR